MNCRTHLTAGELSHSIELARCVKLYAPGGGNQDKVFFFPYRGSLSPRKITLMAADLMEFYPRESLTNLERAVRNTAERCSWTSIRPFKGRYGDPMVEFRGDGWMNMRAADAVIIFKTYTGE